MSKQVPPGTGPARLRNVPSYKDKALCLSLRSDLYIRKDSRGKGLFRGHGRQRESQAASAGLWQLWGTSRAWRRKPGPGVPRGSRAPGSQPWGDSAREQSDHNLSVPVSLQPHLPPDLSKQGKVLQTWQSPSLVEADSCQGAAGAGTGLAGQGERRARRGGAVAALHAHLELKGSPHPPTATLCADCEGAHGHPEQGRAQLKGPAAERLPAPAAVLEGALGLGVGMGLGLTLAFLQTPCVTCPNPTASSNAHTGAGGRPSSWVILIPWEEMGWHLVPEVPEVPRNHTC